MADLENAVARRSAILTELASLSSSVAGGRPDVRSALGGTVEHTKYRLSLYEELRELNELISVLQGPYEYDMRFDP
jgi:hypothetical protein